MERTTEAATRTAEKPSARSKKALPWWQRSMVKSSASVVQADLEAVTAQSPFLQKPLRDQYLLGFFDRSEIQTGRLLGRGGFADVYEIVAFDLNEDLSSQLSPEYQTIREKYAAEAVDPLTGQGIYVIKQLREYLLRDKNEFSNATSDLALEAAYLSQIDHPHIVALRGLPATGLDALAEGRHDGYFLILDRLHETLDDRISQWQLQDEKTQTKMEYARQLASALEYLHERRIIFRDLKPQNIGFDREGQIKLFDFGLCRELPIDNNDMTAVYEMSGVGTRRYMAPEIIKRSGYNAKADVYSWSLVVWQMFTLLKPYAAYSSRDHTKFVCHGGERPPLESATVPPVLQTLLAESWCESVLERCSMADMIRRLDEELEKEEEPLILAPTETTFTDEGIEVVPVGETCLETTTTIAIEENRDGFENASSSFQQRENMFQTVSNQSWSSCDCDAKSASLQSRPPGLTIVSSASYSTEENSSSTEKDAYRTETMITTTPSCMLTATPAA
jgi:serine/threonine protein kinase